MSHRNNYAHFCLERYVELGWSVILAHGVKDDPLTGDLMCACWQGPTCSQPGKHPVYRWKDQPTLTAKELLRRWALYRFDRTFKEDRRVVHPNWAIVLGRSGLCSLDVDQHTGGADGQRSLAELTGRFGRLPATPRDNRGHWLFELPPDATAWPTKIELAPGVELLSGREDADHLLYCAPSGHRDGTPYEWQSGASPWDLAIATLPDWIIEQANNLAAESSVTQQPATNGRAPTFHAPADDSAFERARAYLSRIPPAIAGQGGDNRTFYAACRVVVDFGVNHGQALDLLREWNATCSPPWNDRELERFVRSAIARPGARGRLRDRSRELIDREFAHLRGVPFEIIRPCRRKHGERVPCMCPKCGPAVGAHGSDGTVTCPLGDVLGGEENLSVVDDIKRDRQARAEERAVAEQIRRRHADEHCSDPSIAVQKHRTRPEVAERFLRCGKCPGCRRHKVRRWIDNATFRLTGRGALATVFVGIVSTRDWPKCWGRIAKARGQYLWARIDNRTRLVISTVAAPRLAEVASAEALARFKFQLEMCPDAGWLAGSSRAWQIPKVPRVERNEWETVGRGCKLLREEAKDHLAALNHVQVVHHGPDAEPPARVCRSRRYIFPPVFTRYQRETFLYALQSGLLPSGLDVEDATEPIPPEAPAEDDALGEFNLLHFA